MAARSGVPLGSTTYYFTTIEDLLEQTLRVEIAEFVERTRTWFGSRTDQDFTTIAAEFFFSENARQPGLTAEYDLYLASLSRPFLRPLALQWLDAVVDEFARRVPKETALAIVTLLDGYNIRLVLEERHPTSLERNRVLRQIDALVRDTDH